MSPRPRRVWNWLRILQMSFRRPQRDPRFVPQLDALEDRYCPAVFTPSPLTPDGAPGSLRDAIIQSNNNAASSNEIRLQGGVYTLTVGNDGSGQENAAARGDLDLTAFGKTYVIRGQGQTATVIDADSLDRVFQIFPGVNVEFRNLSIMRGQARDDGSVGSGLVPGDAQGGGVLNRSGNVLFRNVSVNSNAAFGGDGIDGSTGSDGTNGFKAQGGGIYSDGGSVTLNGGTLLEFNFVLGGEGGAGGGEGFGGPGAGGVGGAAQGGGAYLFGTAFSVSEAVSVVNNIVRGGEGGVGGTGADQTTGGAGGTGGAGQGGGLYAESSAVNIVTNGQIDANNAVGGAGGAGGDRGADQGGLGGTGGVGQGGGVYALNGTFSMSQTRVTRGAAVGGDGGTGGRGSASDSGGNGGAGGAGQGGGLFLNVAAPSITQGKVSLNTAVGGAGGRGGDGGTTGSDSLFGGDGGQGGAGQGGGLFVVTSDFTAAITRLTVSSNSALGGTGGRGGDGGTNTNDNDDLSGGNGGVGGDGQGGGLYQAEGTTNIKRSTFANNQALGGTGGRGGDGGRGDDADSGNASLGGGRGGNGGEGMGGGLYSVFPSTLTLINSTVSTNLARGGDGGDGGNGGSAVDTSMGTPTDVTNGRGGDGGDTGSGRGGGLFNAGGTLNLFNSTVAFNEALGGLTGGEGGFGNPNGNTGNLIGGGEGGGVFGGGAEFAFSTIFANNLADNAGPDFFGNLEASRCLFSNAAGVEIIPGTGGPNFINVDPLLRELADNGGPTFTHALRNASTAINRGFNPLNVANDQRGDGFLRTIGGFTDIGAVENGSGVTQPVGR